MHDLIKQSAVTFDEWSGIQSEGRCAKADATHCRVNGPQRGERGQDRGRVYRLAPPGFTPPKPPRLGGATTAELVATLENPNSWWRETAQRLLYQRQDRAAHSRTTCWATSNLPDKILRSLSQSVPRWMSAMPASSIKLQVVPMYAHASIRTIK